MEIKGDDGFVIQLKQNSPLLLGRINLGVSPRDRTISRHHLSIELQETDCPNTVNGGGGKLSFHVAGKNPIFLLQSTTREIRVFRKHDSGEMVCDDMFCVASKEPVWYTLRKSGTDDCSSDFVVGEFSQGIEDVAFGISSIDPVKEFGFMVVGKELEAYPKNRVPTIDKWNWFLSCGGGGGRGEGRKRKAEGDSEEEEWVGEAEEDEKGRGRKMGYTTRSKGDVLQKERRGTQTGREWDECRSNNTTSHEDMEEDEEDSLGGFIVDEEDEVSEEGDEEGDDDEEEDEFEEDESDD